MNGKGQKPGRVRRPASDPEGLATRGERDADHLNPLVFSPHRRQLVFIILMLKKLILKELVLKRGMLPAHLMLVSSLLSAQGMQDSVFQIRGVEVKAVSLFEKESAGMKVTQVDTSILADKAILSLSDLLSENTSVFIKNHGRGALATASFRGSSPSHTRVSWNGIELNNPMAGMTDFSLIPVYLIDQLSLQHGSSSLAGGGGGIGGAIQISNTPCWDERTSMRYIQGIGSYRTFDEFLQLGGGSRKLRFKTRLYHNYSKNNYPYVNPRIGNLDPATGKISHPLETNENAAFFRYGVLQELYYRPRSNQILSLKYWGQFADRSIPGVTSYEGPDNSNLNNQKDADHRMVADWNRYGDQTRWMIRSGYSVKKLDYVQQNRVPGLGMIPVVSSGSVMKSAFNSFTSTYEPLPDLSLEGRFDVNLHDVQTHDSASLTGYHKQRYEMALFFSASRSFMERFNLNLMIRQDWIDGRRAPFSPYLGFDFRLIDGTDLLLKGNIARNYHQPSLNDLYWQPGGNPDLLPEKGITSEAGLEYQLIFTNNLIRTELTAYVSDIKNWIIWIPGFKGYWEPKNISRVRSTGLEYSLLLQGKLHGFGYKLSGTYAYTRSINYGDPLVWGDRSYGKQLVYIPLHSGNLMVNLTYRDFFITYQYNAYGERFTTSSNDLSSRYRLYPYFMNNLAAGRDFKFRGLDLTAEMRIYNLFNESYHSILFRPMPGRNYNVVLMIKI
jgi:outer membrane cobalamin receptor